MKNLNRQGTAFEIVPSGHGYENVMIKTGLAPEYAGHTGSRLTNIICRLNKLIPVFLVKKAGKMIVGQDFSYCFYV